jgi:redox-sensitive bicupin YhaK (pirin superfamily)
MIERRPYATLPGDQRDWLTARHHVPLAPPALADASRWGALRVWNDDEIAGHGGFPAHPHANMEIITYVYEGVITHKDSLGNIGHTRAGDVQVMSAGTGIRHAEYNLEDGAAKLFQIWIVPDRRGGAPAWGTKLFPKANRADQLVVLASGYREDSEALPIRANARVLGATLKAGLSIRYATDTRRLIYLVASRGSLEVNGIRLEKRDGAAITEVSSIDLKAIADTEVVLADVPL